MNRMRARTSAAALLISLALAACGGDGGFSRAATETVGDWLEVALAESESAPDGAERASDEGTSAEPGEREARNADGVPVRVYYRYSDAGGSLRFVEHRNEIPAGARASAERIEVKQEPRTRAEPRRTAAQGAEPKRRPWLQALAQPDPPRRAEADVVIYTTPWCGWCRRTRTFLDERGIRYEDRNIEANDAYRDELIRKTGRTSIPVVEINGEVIQGYNERAMEALL